MSRVHQITFAGLAAETIYELKAHSGSTTEVLGVKTTVSVAPPPPHTAFGQIQTTAGQPAVGALVLVRVLDAELGEHTVLSAVVDEYGFWSLDIGRETCSELDIQAFGTGGTNASLEKANCVDVRPLPTIVLDESIEQTFFLPYVGVK